MTLSQPHVSVVMATYNGERYLRQQLDSILAQTYPLHEIIIEDDCSTDSTTDICKEYEDRYPNVHFYENDHNLGFNLNFQTAVMRATGDFIAISDQDDIWYPTKIEKQIKAIGNHDICFSAMDMGPTEDDSFLVSPPCTLERTMFKGIAGHASLYRKEFIQDKSNWIPYNYYDLGLDISAFLGSGIIKIEEPLNWHRWNSHSATRTLQRKLFSDKKIKSWEPYLYGYQAFRKMQGKMAFINLYSKIAESTSDQRFVVAHRLSTLMLRKGFLSFLELCFTCMHNRAKIYPKPEKTRGLIGVIRGFFFPCIWSYHNSDFDLKR